MKGIQPLEDLPLNPPPTNGRRERVQKVKSRAEKDRHQHGLNLGIYEKFHF